MSINNVTSIAMVVVLLTSMFSSINPFNLAHAASSELNGQTAAEVHYSTDKPCDSRGCDWNMLAQYMKSAGKTPTQGAIQGSAKEPWGKNRVEKKEFNGTSYAVWRDRGDIKVSRSTDNGKSYGVTFNISDSPGISHTPRISPCGNGIVAAWVDTSRDREHWDILFSTSWDRGVTFSPPYNLTYEDAAESHFLKVIENIKPTFKWNVGPREESKEIKCLKRGLDFQIFEITGSSFLGEFGLPQWTYDASTNEFVPIKRPDVAPVPPKPVIIRSGLFTAKFQNNPTGEVLLNNSNDTRSGYDITETWILKDGENEVETTLKGDLEYLPYENNANVTQRFTTNPDYGEFAVKYVIKESEILKYEVTVPAPPKGHEFTVIQHWELPSDAITVEGHGDPGAIQLVEDCNVRGGCTINRADLGTDVLFGLTLSSAHLWITESVESTSSTFTDFSSFVFSKLAHSTNANFTFGPFDQAYTLDPGSFTDRKYSYDGHVYTTASGGSCPSDTPPSATKQINPPSTATNFLTKVPFATTGTCYHGYAEWNISDIPAGVTPTSVIIKYNINLTPSDPLSCLYMPLANRPASTAAHTLYADLGNVSPHGSWPSTGFLDSADSSCTQNPTRITMDLTLRADDDIRSKRDAGTTWFAVGIRMNNEATDGSFPDHIIYIKQGGTSNFPVLSVTWP